MSHRRELREAELVVLAAAERLDRERISKRHADDLTIAMDPSAVLHRAIQRLAEVRSRFDAEAPAAGVNTSIAAAREMDPKVGSVRRRVLIQILARYGRGWGGYTCDAIEGDMRRPHTTVSSAVNWLKENGWLKPSGEYGRTRAGKRAIIWVPTDKALAERSRLASEQALASLTASLTSETS